jgi:hypothetical protein
VSATTSNISNGQRTDGNKGQDMALAVTGRRLHGAKLNRDFFGDQSRYSAVDQPHHDDEEQQRDQGQRHT